MIWRGKGAVRSQNALVLFASRRGHTIFDCVWSSDVCSSDLVPSPPRRPGRSGRDMQDFAWEILHVPAAFVPAAFVPAAFVPAAFVCLCRLCPGFPVGNPA